jgi:hypothetical protein
MSYEICEVENCITGQPLWFVRKNGERATLNFESREDAVIWIEQNDQSSAAE